MLRYSMIRSGSAGPRREVKSIKERSRAASRSRRAARPADLYQSGGPAGVWPAKRSLQIHWAAAIWARVSRTEGKLDPRLRVNCSSERASHESRIWRLAQALYSNSRRQSSGVMFDSLFSVRGAAPGGSAAAADLSVLDARWGSREAPREDETIRRRK